MTMGKSLTRRTSRGWISDQYYFEQLRDIPPKEVEENREKMLQRDPGTYPTDEDIIREIARQRYRKVIESAGSKPAP